MVAKMEPPSHARGAEFVVNIPGWPVQLQKTFES